MIPPNQMSAVSGEPVGFNPDLISDFNPFYKMSSTENGACNLGRLRKSTTSVLGSAASYCYPYYSPQKQKTKKKGGGGGGCGSASAQMDPILTGIRGLEGFLPSTQE